MAVFLYHSPDCPSCLTNTIQMGLAAWASLGSKKEIQPKIVGIGTLLFVTQIL